MADPRMADSGTTDARATSAAVPQATMGSRAADPRTADARAVHDAFVSAVVRVRPSDANAPAFLAMLDDELGRLFSEHELVCVLPEPSDEQSRQRVVSFAASRPQSTVSLVAMGLDQGLEASLNAGVDLAIGDFVYEFESCYDDFAPEVIGELFARATEGGYDIVAACPPQASASVSSRAFYAVFNHFSELGSPLETERFRLVSRRAVNRVASYGRTVPYRKALYATSGLAATSVLYEPRAATGSLSLDRGDRGSTATDAFVLFTDVAFKISALFAGLMALAMLAVLVYVFVAYFGQHRPVEGWAPIMGVLSLGLFAVFSILAVIIKYLDVLVRLVFRRQRYLVASIERL